MGGGKKTKKLRTQNNQTEQMVVTLFFFQRNYSELLYYATPWNHFFNYNSSLRCFFFWGSVCVCVCAGRILPGSTGSASRRVRENLSSDEKPRAVNSPQPFSRRCLMMFPVSYDLIWCLFDGPRPRKTVTGCCISSRTKRIDIFRINVISHKRAGTEVGAWPWLSSDFDFLF